MASDDETKEPGSDLDRVARHMIRCRPCVDLAGDSAEFRSLAERYLAGDGPRIDDDTLVGAVLRKTVAGGTMVLADLVYELAKAAMVAEDRFRRHVLIVEEPRERGEVLRRVEGLSERLGAFTDDELPQRCRHAARACEHDEPLPAGRVLLGLVLALEGSSYRYRLAQANLETTARRTDVALELARSILDDREAPDDMRLYAYRSAIRAACVGEHHDEARALVAEASAAFPDDAILAINCVSAGFLIRDSQAVERAARVLKVPGALADRWVHDLAEAVALSIHEEVDHVSLDEARAACGL